MFLLAFFVTLFILVVIAAIVVILVAAVNTPYNSDVYSDVDLLTMVNAITGQSLELHLEEHAARPRRLRPDIVEMRDTLLHQFDALCDTYNVEYWLTQSTLLGAVRHGTLIPWCDTLHVAVPYTDLQKIIGMRSRLSSEYALLTHMNGYRFCCNNFARFPAIDISVMSDNAVEMSICTPLNELGSCTFKDTVDSRKLVYDTHIVLPLKQRQLQLFTNDTPNQDDTDSTNVMNVKIPNNAYRVLDILYGPDWMHTVGCSKRMPEICNRFTTGLLRRLTFRN